MSKKMATRQGHPLYLQLALRCWSEQVSWHDMTSTKSANGLHMQTRPPTLPFEMVCCHCSKSAETDCPEVQTDKITSLTGRVNKVSWGIALGLSSHADKDFTWPFVAIVPSQQRGIVQIVQTGKISSHRVVLSQLSVANCSTFSNCFKLPHLFNMLQLPHLFNMLQIVPPFQYVTIAPPFQCVANFSTFSNWTMLFCGSVFHPAKHRASIRGERFDQIKRRRALKVAFRFLWVNKILQGYSLMN